MYKHLFTLLYKLIADPSNTFEQLSSEPETNNEQFNKNYLYPIFGLLALAAFVGALFSTREFAVAIALRSVIKQLIIYVSSYYLLSFLLAEKVFPRFFHLPKNKIRIGRFVGYASSALYIAVILHLLFEGFPIVMIGALYVFYQVWKSVSVYLKVPEEQQLIFTLATGATLLITPAVIGLLLNVLMPGL